MTILQSVLFAAVSFGASIVGAICGIGGGVIIKPVLDLFSWASVTTISFLSGCTVFAMSCYSVSKSIFAGEHNVDLHIGTPLAAGAALGGVLGKQIFSAIKAAASNPEMVGGIQAGCLAIITIGTLGYTVYKDRIRTYRASDIPMCLGIGSTLGIISSFLGIGGGPINLVVLHYFFSMDTKVAAANSLYIILFSQAANLATTIITGTVPEFTFATLLFMTASGVAGGVVGRRINKRLDLSAVDKLFIALMISIILISIYNTWKLL